ncbi:NUDIX domain-containing protein [Candidatus Woesearchaeota archaeon]|nr:NUDIX domain-containing protein [Candidatus Woesearchaeota archaeon]
MEKDVLVISRKILFDAEKDKFQGFKAHSDIDFHSRIIKGCKYMKRGIAEEDETHKQPIGYVLIANPKTKKIYAYKRASAGKDYTEKRLQNKWSVGIGGHIDRTEESAQDPIHTSMLRELSEEVKIGQYSLKVLGYLNDDSDSVGRVHFGIVYLALTESDVSPGDAESVFGEMKTMEEIKQIRNSPDATLEGWSEIAIDFLEKNLSEIV